MKNLRIENEWQDETYFIGDHQLEKDDKIKIEWPDLEITEHIVNYKTEFNETHNNYNKRFFITLNFHGVKARIYLKDIRKLRFDLVVEPN